MKNNYYIVIDDECASGVGHAFDSWSSDLPGCGFWKCINCGKRFDILMDKEKAEDFIPEKFISIEEALSTIEAMEDEISDLKNYSRNEQ